MPSEELGEPVVRGTFWKVGAGLPMPPSSPGLVIPVLLLLCSFTSGDLPVDLMGTKPQSHLRPPITPGSNLKSPFSGMTLPGI